MDYPNRIIKRGEKDPVIMDAIQRELNAKNCGPVPLTDVFDNRTLSAVKLFQTRHTDISGTPLKADGQIGPLTWAVLFGIDQLPVNNEASSSLLSTTLSVAATQLGVVEVPPNSNRGPMVDLYLESVGLDPAGNHYSWCAAFVYWCFQQAANQLGIGNPLIKTAGCLDQWNRAVCRKITKQNALQNPSLVRPGFIFIIDHGNGSGHSGLVESSGGGLLNTIEGNTNPQLSPDGYGVFRLKRRKIADITKGFLDYGSVSG